MKTEIKRNIVSIPIAIGMFALLIASIAGCLTMLTGCITTPDGKKQVSPIVIDVTRDIVCAGSAAETTVQPQSQPFFVVAERSVARMIATSNTSPAELQRALAPLLSTNSSPWILPAVSLATSWSRIGIAQDDSNSALLILEAIHDGLTCAVLPPVASRAKTLAADAPRPDKVCVYTEVEKGSSWFRVAANGRIVTTWATKVDGKPAQKFSVWYSSAKRAAIRENPSIEVIEYK